MQLSDRIGSRMKLHDLHVLMTVVQAGSMGKAAQILNTTQPNVSRSIKELESALGVRLLDRHRRGIEATDYGRALLECGAAVFDELRQGVKNIASVADPTAGELRIGTTTFLAASLVSALVDRLSRLYPRMVFDVVSGYTESLHNLLADRKVDLLVTRGSAPVTDPRYNFEVLFEDSYIVAAGAQNQWVRRRKIAIAELANESWVLPPRDSVIGSIVAGAFRESGFDYPRVSLVTDCPHMRVSLLETGRFITIFPASAFRFLTKRSELKVLPVELPMARRPNGIVTLKKRAPSPMAELFIHHARELAKPLARRRP